MKLNIIQKRKYFYLLSFTLTLISVLSLIAWGLKPGIDFTGGSLLEVKFDQERPDNDLLQKTLVEFNLGDLKIQPAGDSSVIFRFKDVDEDTHQAILTKLQTDLKMTAEERFESIGPIIGKELEQKAWLAIILASMMIIIYIAYAFRKVSKPVASWKYGVTAVVALIHDVLIVIGIFSLLGHFAGLEVDGLFITALLTILGFSVHDTIVVFDRTRENLSKHYSSDFEKVVNDSINQTLIRSINTSLTTLLVLITLYIFGGATISNFVLALIIGIAFGTYSSIFVASALVVTWHYFEQKVKTHK